MIGCEELNEKKYYKVQIDIWSFDWERSEVFFFKTEKSAKKFCEEQKEKIPAWLAKRTNIDIYIVTFEEMKQEITVADFEELFETIVVDDYD